MLLDTVDVKKADGSVDSIEFSSIKVSVLSSLCFFAHFCCRHTACDSSFGASAFTTAAGTPSLLTSRRRAGGSAIEPSSILTYHCGKSI